MPDESITDRLRAALDSAEHEVDDAHHIGCFWFAEDGHCDCNVPAQRRALVARDRALLADHLAAEVALTDAMHEYAAGGSSNGELIAVTARAKALREEVGRAAKVWLGEDTPK